MGYFFSKPGGKDMIEALFSQYEGVFHQLFEEYAFPPIITLVTRMDFGHSDPMWTLPYGALTEINPIAKTVIILENGVE